MTSTELLTLSARIAALERTVLNGQEAQNALKQLYQEQERVLNAIETIQNTIYAGEDAEASLARIAALLDVPLPVVTALAVETNAEDVPALQIGEVLVVGEPETTPEEAPAPQTATEFAQQERQPTLLADLTAHPASSSREVQARLGWALSTAANWLTRLTVEGLLSVDQSDYPYRYSVTGQAEMDLTAVTSAVPEAPSEPEQATPLPRPDGPRANAIAWLAAHGPHRAKDVAAALSLYSGPCAIQLNALVREGRLMSFPGTTPVIYAVPGTPLPAPEEQTVQSIRTTPPSKPSKKPAEPAPAPAVLHAAPDQAELVTTMRANAAQVLSLLAPGQEYTEVELTKASGLALSHLRMALGNLQGSGQVQRLDGVGTRSVYRLEQLDLPAPEGSELTPAGEQVAAHLAYVTGRSERDTASNIATNLRLPRAEVDQALAVLNAQGRLAYTRVSNLVMYTLKAPSSEQAAD